MGYQMLLADEEIDVGPLFVKHLKDEGKIESNEFSFAMNGFDEDNSHLDFGAPLAKRVQGGSLKTMTYIPFFEDFFWSVPW